ncbi:MAG: flagellar export chaperone FliS [Vicinamibacterales bacterium]
MHSSTARAAAAYQQVEVTSRSPLELVVLLYDGAIGALRQTHDAMVTRDLAAKARSMKKALHIVHHLQSTLNMQEGGEVAANLDAVYRDVIGRILEANLQGAPELLDEAIALLTTVRQGWSEIADAPAPSTDNVLSLNSGTAR